MIINETRAEFINRRARQISPMSWRTHDAGLLMSQIEQDCWIGSLEKAEDEWLAEHEDETPALPAGQDVSTSGNGVTE